MSPLLQRLGGDFLPTFLLCALILIPVLLWMERRTRGEFFLDAVRNDSADEASTALSAGC